MNALAVFTLAPAAVALLRGRRIGWLVFAALLIVVSLFSGNLGTAAILWLACLAIAFLL